MAIANIETLDIHAGGIDLVFPHHENEIAQSESLTGKPFSRFWLHAEFLMVEGQKMSKSLGNYYTLRDLLGKGYEPEAIRFLLASVPYRKQLNFTMDGLRSARTAIERLRNFKLVPKPTILDGSNDYVAAPSKPPPRSSRPWITTSTRPTALAAAFEYLRDANSAMDAGGFRAGDAAAALDFLKRVDAVFDVIEPTTATNAIADSEIESLVEQRNAAKKAKDFAGADQIRQQLLDQGVVLEDTKSGVRWKRK